MLANLRGGFAEGEDVSDTDGVFDQAERGEILSERTRRQIAPGQFLAP
jgi:hypothetical protein